MKNQQIKKTKYINTEKLAQYRESTMNGMRDCRCIRITLIHSFIRSFIIDNGRRGRRCGCFRNGRFIILVILQTVFV